jgi:hypothetical protein
MKKRVAETPVAKKQRMIGHVAPAQRREYFSSTMTRFS